MWHLLVLDKSHRQKQVLGENDVLASGCAAQASPFQERSLNAVHQILPFTDYFRFPHVLYFESIPDLLKRPGSAETCH